MTSRDELLSLIRSNIAAHGRHLYMIGGAASPQFAYTIGLAPVVGKELIFAGGALFSIPEVAQLLNSIGEVLTQQPGLDPPRVEVPELGSFLLQEAHPSWAKTLLLGALDYYDTDAIRALQIVPATENWTVDVPDMTRPWTADSEPVWCWHVQPWPFPVSEQSMAVTNLEALRGQPITEVARWEDNLWEMFAGEGCDVPPDQVREVPLATLLGADASLYPVVKLPVGGGLWRESAEAKWQDWE